MHVRVASISPPQKFDSLQLQELRRIAICNVLPFFVTDHARFFQAVHESCALLVRGPRIVDRKLCRLVSMQINPSPSPSLERCLTYHDSICRCSFQQRRKRVQTEEAARRNPNICSPGVRKRYSSRLRP